MPDYDQPVTAAREASVAMRALAHATQKLGDRPGDTFDVLGDLLSILPSMVTVLHNLAQVQDRYAVGAVDDAGRDPDAGRKMAEQGARYLRKAAREIAGDYQYVDYAMTFNSRIIWPSGSHARQPRSPVQTAPTGMGATPTTPAGRSL